MNWRKITIYLFFPLSITLPMIFMYFSGVNALQHIVSPEFDGLYWNSNRELGLLENLQHVIILAMLVIVVRAILVVKSPSRRGALALLAVAVAFILLEELDWGRHYYEFVMGVPEDQALETRNWHNVGSRTELTKLAVDGFMIALFLVAPFALSGSAFPLVRLLTPDRYAAFGLASMLVARLAIYALEKGGFGTPGTLDRDLNEFREILTYYLFAAYMFDAFERRLRGLPPLGEEPPNAISPQVRTAPALPQ
jgi:hypothetical protein